MLPLNGELRVIVVDDHLVVRDALKAALVTAPGVQQVECAKYETEAVQLCADFHPDVVLFNMVKPSSAKTETLELINRQWPFARCVILTDTPQPILAGMARKEGGTALLGSSDTLSVLVDAVHTAASGGVFISSPPRNKPAADGSPTRREVEVLQHLSRGLSNEEIGQALGISCETVKGHLKNLFPKLDAANRAEAVSRAYQLGLL